MTGIFIRVVAAVLVVLAVLAGIGLLLPRGYDVQTETTVSAPATTIFPMINSLANWRLWSTWNSEKNTSIEIQYSMRTEGEGASLAWREPRGNGRLVVNRSVPNQEVVYFSDFEGFPQMVSLIRLIPLEDGRTRVVWRSYGQLPRGPFYGWAAMVFGTGLRAQYNRDLEALKVLCETEFQQLGAPPPSSQRSYDPGLNM